MKTFSLFVVATIWLLLSCNTKNETHKESSETQQKTTTVAKPKKAIVRTKPITDVHYHKESGKKWIAAQTDSFKIHVVCSINRADSSHLAMMDSIIVPDSITGGLEFYMPFPLSLPIVKDIDKIIFFSYPAQAFGAYENGDLVYTGATNMGRKKDTTPTGLFYTNWKAEQTTSTFNDEWDLKWNFNIESKLGVGWHEYAMPGYPASHSCLRLLEKDAKYLYNWADQWVLDKKEQLISPGTPVIVFGSYNFGGPKPWKKLVDDPHALDIIETVLNEVVQPYIEDIRKAKAPATQPEKTK